jgi:hypothetical protein
MGAGRAHASRYDLGRWRPSPPQCVSCWRIDDHLVKSQARPCAQHAIADTIDRGRRHAGRCQVADHHVAKKWTTHGRVNAMSATEYAAPGCSGDLVIISHADEIVRREAILTEVQ